MKLALLVPVVFFGVAKAQSPELTVTVGTDDVCREQLDAARTKVGYSKFKTGATGIPAGTETAKWQYFCEFLVPDESVSGDASSTASLQGKVVESPGTFGVKKQSGTTPECSAAVTEWSQAFKNFKGLPPNLGTDDHTYDSPENMSFVFLYNPSRDAASVCHVVTCTKKKAADAKAAEVSGSALMCLSTPDAFEGDKQPFTQEQWNKLVASLKDSSGNSDFVTVPTLLNAIFMASVFSVALL